MSDFDFPLSVDQGDVIPESFKSLYEEKEGKFTLVEGLRKKVDTAGLTSALETERKIRKENERLAKDFKALGLSAEEIKQMVADKAKVDEEKQMKAGEFDSLKNQIVDKHRKELEEKDQQIKETKKIIERQVVDAVAVREIAAAEGNPDLLMVHIKNMTRVVEESGDYQVRVLNVKGEPRVNAQGEYLTIKDLVAELKQSETFGVCFKGSGRTGSGMPTGSSSGGGAAQESELKRSKMTLKQKTDYIKDHGDKKYNQLPW